MVGQTKERTPEHDSLEALDSSLQDVRSLGCRPSSVSRGSSTKSGGRSMRQPPIAIGASLVMLLLVTAPVLCSDVTLQIPTHGGSWIRLSTDRSADREEEVLRRARRRAAQESSDAGVLLEEKLAAQERSRADRLTAILSEHNIDEPSIHRDYNQVQTIMTIPGRMTVIAADHFASEVLFYANNGRLIHSVEIPGGTPDVEASGGWTIPYRVAMFWFPIDERARYVGVVISYTLGEPSAGGPGPAFLFARPFVLDPDGHLNGGPTALLGARAISESDFPDQLRPSTGRALIGDTNGDGFQDVVLWRKQFVLTSECVRLESQSARVMRFSPADKRFLEPQAAAELMPIDEVMWYGSRCAPDSPDIDRGLWPLICDPSEEILCDRFCEGDVPGKP